MTTFRDMFESLMMLWLEYSQSSFRCYYHTCPLESAANSRGPNLFPWDGTTRTGGRCVSYSPLDNQKENRLKLCSCGPLVPSDSMPILRSTGQRQARHRNNMAGAYAELDCNGAIVAGRVANMFDCSYHSLRRL